MGADQGRRPSRRVPLWCAEPDQGHPGPWRGDEACFRGQGKRQDRQTDRSLTREEAWISTSDRQEPEATAARDLTASAAGFADHTYLNKRPLPSVGSAVRVSVADGHKTSLSSCLESGQSPSWSLSSNSAVRVPRHNRSIDSRYGRGQHTCGQSSAQGANGFCGKARSSRISRKSSRDRIGSRSTSFRNRGRSMKPRSMDRRRQVMARSA